MRSFLTDKNIRMAYGHRRSRSCGGLEGNLWPHLIFSSLEGFRKFLEKSDRQTHRRTHKVTHTQTHPRSDTHTDALGTPHPMNCFTVPPLPHTPPPAAHSVHTVTTLPSPGSLTVIPQCPVSQSDSQTLRKLSIFPYFEFEKI